MRAAAPVQTRVIMAAFVPLAVLLGPVIVPLLWWFPERVDPASRNPLPGATANVIATVHGEFSGPIRLEHDEDLTLDANSPAEQKLPPLRETLEKRLAQWRRESDLSKQPWELQEAGRWTGRMLAHDLAEYLKHDIPAQTLSWTLATPEEAGRFSVTLQPEGREAVEVVLATGNDQPPEPKEDLGDGKPVQVLRPGDADSPIQSVKVTWSEKKEQGQDKFWAPLAAWEGSAWSKWDIGWLLLYIMVYVPAMFVLRWVLRLA